MRKFLLLLFLPSLFCSAQNVAYLYGDVAADGTQPSGAAAPYDQMLLTDTGSTGCSQFKAMVEAEGYSISQHYDQTTTLNAAFLNQFQVIVFGLHQKLWSAAEKAALDVWIRAGGGILMFSDSAAGGRFNIVGINNPTGQNAVNNILSAYGMEVTVDQGGGTRAYTSPPNSPHPVIWDQPVFEGEGVSPVAVDPNSDATVLIPLDDAYKISGGNMNPGTGGISIANPDWAVLAHSPVDSGHVMAMFDRQPLWNNGPGSDINEEDNKKVLRRIIRYLARDYGNSPEWIGLTSFDRNELSYRQWRGGAGMPGTNYIARNNFVTLEQTTDLQQGNWQPSSMWYELVSTIAEPDGETERVTLRLQADLIDPLGFTRVCLVPGIATNVPPTNSGNIVRAINCGGPAFLASDGIQYEADTLFTGGHIDAFPGNAVANTEDDLLYNYARSNHSAYNIPVANGSYTVTLRFAETFFNANNKRVFDASIEGALVADDLDLHAVAPGKWVAYDRNFTTTVSDGMLNLNFSSSVNNALLNAILVQAN